MEGDVVDMGNICETQHGWSKKESEWMACNKAIKDIKCDQNCNTTKHHTIPSENVYVNKNGQKISNQKWSENVGPKMVRTNMQTQFSVWSNL